jgi:hypothetical protein
MTIELFDFPETFSDAANYEYLGFIVGVDDPVNGTFSATYNPEGKTDAAGVLGLMESCEDYKLMPNISIDGELYCFKEGFKIIDEIASVDTYIDGVGTLL